MGWQPNRVLLQGLILLTFSFHWYVLATQSSGNARTFTIHWNTSNPIFRIDNTDNIIDVNKDNMKFEYDQVNLICPVYMPGTREEETEKYIIYNVSKDEYGTCRITNPNPRIIAVCDKPFKVMYFTITFRPFTPQPGGLEFLPGHDYYFISTSTGDDLHRRIGGRCTTHNMKIVFKVWGPSAPNMATTQPPPPPPMSRPTWMSVTAPPRYSPAAAAPSSTAHPPPVPPPFNHPQPPPPLPPNQPPPSTTKKSKTYNKHPNEVVKSEELTLGGGAAAAGAHSLASRLLGVALTLVVLCFSLR